MGLNLLLEINRLCSCFNDCFINNHFEFIATTKKNGADAYFSLGTIYSLEDLKLKVLSHLSRASCKTHFYKNTKMNDSVHKYIRDGINNFLGTKFNKEDMLLVYTRLGNGINNKLGMEFINNNYDLKILEK